MLFLQKAKHTCFLQLSQIGYVRGCSCPYSRPSAASLVEVVELLSQLRVIVGGNGAGSQFSRILLLYVLQLGSCGGEVSNSVRDLIS
jgi:hypothetical protein